MNSIEETVFISTMISFFTTFSTFIIGYYILLIIARWKVYTKSNKAGWITFIPIYNEVVLFQIAGISPWLLLLYIVPIVNIIAIPVIEIIKNVGISTKFGKGTLFTIGLIFVTPIFYMILGFGDAKYNSIEE
ncbi:MAG: DUF5684 domain-containing protein [Clostridia bacterium]